MTAANALYYGDCLAVMEEMPAESVDLIYLDPPFNSNADYHAIYKEETGRPLPDQVEAFSDMWRLDAARERAVAGLPVMMRRYDLDDDVAELWRLWANALRKLNPSLLAYLSYMTERLVAMRRLLKPDGSVYLHCDPTASHYLKMVMDAVFGHQNFRNEIIWRRTGAHGGAKRWGPIHDTLLFYTMSAGLARPGGARLLAAAGLHSASARRAIEFQSSAPRHPRKSAPSGLAERRVMPYYGACSDRLRKGGDPVVHTSRPRAAASPAARR